MLQPSLEPGTPGAPLTYLQGMNAISAPFLYSMPEVDAFACFCKLVVERFPLYWLSDTAGASAGCKVRIGHVISTGVMLRPFIRFADRFYPVCM